MSSTHYECDINSPEPNPGHLFVGGNDLLGVVGTLWAAYNGIAVMTVVSYPNSAADWVPRVSKGMTRNNEAAK